MLGSPSESSHFRMNSRLVDSKRFRISEMQSIRNAFWESLLQPSLFCQRRVRIRERIRYRMDHRRLVQVIPGTQHMSRNTLPPPSPSFCHHWAPGAHWTRAHIGNWLALELDRRFLWMGCLDQRAKSKSHLNNSIQ